MSTSSYATAADMLKRYDQRVIGDLVGDTGAQVNTASLLNDPNVQSALDDASGVINSCVLVANKYNPTDLAALTGVDKAFLVRLVCNLAYIMLVQRRGQPTDKIAQYQETMDVLDLIRRGERVFGVAAEEAAGNPSASFPAASVYSALNLMRDVSKIYPVRRQQRIS